MVFAVHGGAWAIPDEKKERPGQRRTAWPTKKRGTGPFREPRLNGLVELRGSVGKATTSTGSWRKASLVFNQGPRARGG